jgi:hypothetical protein
MLVVKLVIIERTHNRAEKVASMFFSIITRITVIMRNKMKQIKDVVPIISKSFGLVDKESIRLLNDMSFPFLWLFSLQKYFVLLY